MSALCQGDWEEVARIGMYLNRGSRMIIQLLPFGRDDGVIRASSDSDQAGCLRTRMPEMCT